MSLTKCIKIFRNNLHCCSRVSSSVLFFEGIILKIPNCKSNIPRAFSLNVSNEVCVVQSARGYLVDHLHS